MVIFHGYVKLPEDKSMDQSFNITTYHGNVLRNSVVSAWLGPIAMGPPLGAPVELMKHASLEAEDRIQVSGNKSLYTSTKYWLVDRDFPIGLS